MELILRNTLLLNDEQLYEVARAVQDQYVDLHKGIATNSCGVHQAVIGRMRESRNALGEVFAMILDIKPEWTDTFNRPEFVAARAQAEAEWS